MRHFVHWAIPEMGVRVGGWEHTFLKKPLEFFIFYFTAEISRQNKASQLEIPHLFVRSFGNSKTKQKARPLDGDSIIFSWSPLEIPLHFWLPPLEIPHVWFFFWNSLFQNSVDRVICICNYCDSSLMSLEDSKILDKYADNY